MFGLNIVIFVFTSNIKWNVVIICTCWFLPIQRIIHLKSFNIINLLKRTHSNKFWVWLLGRAPPGSSSPLLARLCWSWLRCGHTGVRALRRRIFCFWAAAAKSTAYILKFKYFLPAPASVKYFLCVRPPGGHLVTSDQLWRHGNVTFNSQLLLFRFYDYDIDILDNSQEAMLKFAVGDSTLQLRWQSMTNHFNISP